MSLHHTYGFPLPASRFPLQIPTPTDSFKVQAAIFPRAESPERLNNCVSALIGRASAQDTRVILEAGS